MSNLLIFLLVVAGIYYGGKMLIRYAAIKFISNINTKVQQQQRDFQQRQRSPASAPKEGEIKVEHAPQEKAKLGDQGGEYIEFEEIS